MNSRMGQAAAAYRQAAASVHPTVAVVKLYDATLLAISQAIRAREAGQFEECFVKVMRAATILRGLDHALDYAKGGAVAERLHRVYKGYIIALHVSYGKPDVIRRYRKLHDSLIELRDAWAGIAGMARSRRDADAFQLWMCCQLQEAGIVVIDDRRAESQFVKCLYKVVGEGIVVIDEQKHGVIP